jgi:membrane protein
VLRVVNAVMCLVIVTVLFGMIFRLLPNAKVAWGHVWVGAGASPWLFTVAKFFIGLYLGTASVSSEYGTAS